MPEQRDHQVLEQLLPRTVRDGSAAHRAIKLLQTEWGLRQSGMRPLVKVGGSEEAHAETKSQAVQAGVSSAEASVQATMSTSEASTTTSEASTASHRPSLPFEEEPEDENMGGMYGAFSRLLEEVTGKTSRCSENRPTHS